MKTLKDFQEYRKVRQQVKEILSEDNHNFW
jgi:hypothetical protein